MEKEIILLKNSGIDTQKALLNFFGDEELYLYFIKEFLNDNYFSRLKFLIRIKSRGSSIKIAEFIEKLSEKLGLCEMNKLSDSLLLSLNKNKMKNAAADLKAVIEEKEKLLDIIIS